MLAHRSDVQRGALPGLVVSLTPNARAELLSAEWYICWDLPSNGARQTGGRPHLCKAPEHTSAVETGNQDAPRWLTEWRMPRVGRATRGDQTRLLGAPRHRIEPNTHAELPSARRRARRRTRGRRRPCSGREGSSVVYVLRLHRSPSTTNGVQRTGSCPSIHISAMSERSRPRKDAIVAYDGVGAPGRKDAPSAVT
jgi:hypothetical protein